MDTGDPVQDDSQKKRGKGKKKKEKGKTFTLDEFMQKVDSGGSAPPSNNWAVMSENIDDEEEGGYKFNRALLPTAPKAAMGPSVDLSLIPNDGPFSAYIGNLSYDAKEEDLEKLFSQLEIETVRIISDAGRPKGYAYVDFVTKESLIEALGYNERDYMGRTLRVDLATDKNQDGRGGYNSGPKRSDEPDRTEGDWRRKDPTPSGPGNSLGGSRDDSDRGGRFGDRDRFSDRRGGGSGFGDRDGGFGNRDRDRGFGGDRDRGFGGDRDRGFGGDRDRDRGYGGDRDRGFGGDRDRGFGGNRDRGYGGDRDQGYNRDRGYGGDRDRGYGGDRDRGYGRDRDRGYGGDRDRDFGDRDGGGRYGSSRGGYNDRSYGRRDDYGRAPNRDFDRRPSSRDGSRDGGQGPDRGGRDEGSDRRPLSRNGSQERRSDGPKERPVLKLQPRSKPADSQEKKDADQQRASSIFGSAKPVDTYAKEKEIEEKLKKKDVEKDDPVKRREGGDSRWQRDEGTAPASKREDPSSRLSEEGTDEPRSPTSQKADIQQPKMVPAPAPKENAWGRKPEMSSPASPPIRESPNSNASNSSSAPPRRDDRQQRPPAGAGRGNRQDQHKGDSNRDRRPGPRSNGDGSEQPPAKAKPVREKQLPKSIEEMPKYEESRSRDFSNKTRFSALAAEGDDSSDETA